MIAPARTRVALAALAFVSCSRAERPAPASGPAVALPGASSEPASCAGCHPAQHAEWSTSRHAAAWVDPIFQAEFARGRPAWCVGCHAPLAPDPLAVDDADPRASQGVGCAGCHLRDGRMVSSRAAPGSPHATVIDPAFGTTALCARCHEFSFPILGARGQLERYTGEPMQATVSQFLQSGLAGDMECADCHAATGAGHAFPGSHDPAMVASALEISLCHAQPETGGELAVELVVELANRGAGHNVPTGGVHRHMVLRPGARPRPSDCGRRISDAGSGRVREGDVPSVVVREMLQAGVHPRALRKILHEALSVADAHRGHEKQLNAVDRWGDLLSGRWLGWALGWMGKKEIEQEGREQNETIEQALQDLTLWEQRFNMSDPDPSTR